MTTTEAPTEAPRPQGSCPKCGQPDAFHHPQYVEVGGADYRSERLEWRCLRCDYPIQTPVLGATA